MGKYIGIGIGGFLGAMSRYGIKNINIHAYDGDFPVKTLVVNIAGSFSLALILAAALRISKFDDRLKIGLTTGFLGAFTTFSTFCREVVNLVFTGHYFTAFFYISLSVLAGLAAAWFGTFVAGKLIIRSSDINICTDIKNDVKEKEPEVE